MNSDYFLQTNPQIINTLSIKNQYIQNNPTINFQMNTQEDTIMYENLLAYLNQNDPKNFRTICSSSKYIPENILKGVFKEALELLKSGQIYASRFISILISFGIDPNLLICEDNSKINILNINYNNPQETTYFPNAKSILMFFCELSMSSLVSNLTDLNNIYNTSLNVNYLDIKRRNALFYLKGGKEDKKIIEILTKKGIDINQKDKDENTALHYAILNIGNLDLIYNLIEIGNADFTIKNAQGKTSLELISNKFILRINKINTNSNITDFKEIEKLLEMIKSKLSIHVSSSKILLKTENNINNNSNTLYGSLIKLPANNDEEKIKNLNDNLFVKLNPYSSLIVDTSFNDGNYLTPTKEKIDYYIKLNQNKKYFLNLLKNNENAMLEKSSELQKEINAQKEKINELRNKLKSTMEKNDKMNNEDNPAIIKLNKELTKDKNKVNEYKQKIQKNHQPDSFIDIPGGKNFSYKYNQMIRINPDDEYIYSQLRKDLLDFMYYVNNKNKKLETTLKNLNDFINKCVKESLGNDYSLKMYGSRATKLCLPWSDIDYVICCNNDNLKTEPLSILHTYLMKYMKYFENLKYIYNTQIPLLKVFTNSEFHNISLDISLENPDHHGEECVNYIKEKIKQYEVLTPLTLAIKTILMKASLNDPYKGGLSSYGVILLVINFLNILQNQGCDISMKNLGKTFYELLKYYGFDYDVSNFIIVDQDKENQNDGDLIQKILSIHQFQIMKGEFIIIDPLNIANNVAKNTRQFKNIKFVFQMGYSNTKDSCECGCHYQYEGLCIKEENCEHNLLNTIFNSVARN